MKNKRRMGKITQGIFLVLQNVAIQLLISCVYAKHIFANNFNVPGQSDSL